MVRGCPISSILNAHDVSPTNRHPARNQNSASLQSPTALASLPQSHYASNQSARYTQLPPIVLSPNRGALYNRRASPNRKPIPPTQMKNDQTIDWYDTDPPSHELDFNKFSVFNAILNHPEIAYEFTKYLDLTTLISLYSISKDFHNLMNRRFTTMILARSRGKAAESSQVFLFKCYRNLCQRDPAARKNTENANEVRTVPSFRWLRLIFYREKVVDEIIACLAAEGHRLPKYTSMAIKKIWFLLDIGDNPRRISVVQNKNIWTKRDLFLATMFFIKLDMRLTDPVNGNGEVRMRKMLFAQRSLTTLWRVLKREAMLTQLDMARMFVQWAYNPLPQHRGMSIVGVPPNEIGRGEYESWGLGPNKILKPDDLVLRKTARRKMNMKKKYLDMMLWGHVDKTTFQDIWPPQVPAEEDTALLEEEDSEETESIEYGGQELVNLDLLG